MFSTTFGSASTAYREHDTSQVSTRPREDARSAVQTGIMNFIGNTLPTEGYIPAIIKEWKDNAMRQVDSITNRVLSKCDNLPANTATWAVTFYVPMADEDHPILTSNPTEPATREPRLHAVVSADERFLGTPDLGTLTLHSPTYNLRKTVADFATKHGLTTAASEQITNGLLTNIDDMMEQLSLGQKIKEGSYAVDSRFGWQSGLDDPFYSGDAQQPSVKFTLIGKIKTSGNDTKIVEMPPFAISATSSVALFSEESGRNHTKQYATANYPLFYTQVPY